MSANNDTISKTVTVTVLLCVICSVVVSAAAVILKPKQVANKDLDRKTNILAAAGLLHQVNRLMSCSHRSQPKWLIWKQASSLMQ